MFALFKYRSSIYVSVAFAQSHNLEIVIKLSSVFVEASAKSELEQSTMACGYSGVQVISFVVLLLGTAAIIVSLATNFWVMQSNSIRKCPKCLNLFESNGFAVTVETKIHSGLIFRCMSGEANILGHHESKAGCINRYGSGFQSSRIFNSLLQLLRSV
jgi:hypothetical protein